MKTCILVFLFGIFSFASEAATQKKFFVERYGDDYAAFRRLCDDVNNNMGGKVIFPRGKTYVLSIVDDYNGGHRTMPQEGAVLLFFRGCKNVEVDLNGCSIILLPNHSTKYALCLFYDCESFLLKNGNLIGDSFKHDYSHVIYNGRTEQSSHEWGYGVLVRGASGIIKDITIANMTGDGVYVAGYRTEKKDLHSSLSIENCEISFCRRNGISCASTKKFILKDSHIHHIGSHGGVIGTSPEAGIDLEYEDGIGDKGDVIIKGTRITDCSQKVISASNSTPPTPDNFLIENCYLEGSSFQIFHVKRGRSKKVRNCVVVKCPIYLGDADVINTKFDLGCGIHYVSGGNYKNCLFKGTLEKSDSNYGCTIAGINLAETVFENCSFADIRASNGKSPSFQGFSGYHFPLKATFKKCLISNCSFVKGGTKNVSFFSFYDSKLINGCGIYNLTEDKPVIFERCELTDVSAYQSQTGRFIFKKTALTQKDKSMTLPLLLFGNNSFERCTIIDEVGFPIASAKKHGIKSYKINAVHTKISLKAETIETEGMSLVRGEIRGVSKSKFKGTQSAVKFR